MKANIEGYHAHVYFDPDQQAAAASIREQVEAEFEVVMGRWRHEPDGPHPKSMYQIAFANTEFASLVPWLMLNHDGLDVLVHPNTGDNLADHTERAMWIGANLALNVDVFQSSASKRGDSR